MYSTSRPRGGRTYVLYECASSGARQTLHCLLDVQVPDLSRPASLTGALCCKASCYHHPRYLFSRPHPKTLDAHDHLRWARASCIGPSLSMCAAYMLCIIAFWLPLEHFESETAPLTSRLIAVREALHLHHPPANNKTRPLVS